MEYFCTGYSVRFDSCVVWRTLTFKQMIITRDCENPSIEAVLSSRAVINPGTVQFSRWMPMMVALSHRTKHIIIFMK